VNYCSYLTFEYTSSTLYVRRLLLFIFKRTQMQMQMQTPMPTMQMQITMVVVVVVVVVVVSEGVSNDGMSSPATRSEIKNKNH
jgi:hypothetical protein